MKHCIINKASVIDHSSTEIISINSNGDEITVALLSKLYRVVEINSKLDDNNQFFKDALLMNDAISFKANWAESNSANSVSQGDIVSIRALLPITSSNGCIGISRLVKYQQPVASINLFDTIPEN